jgi:hypothetical protein
MASCVVFSNGSQGCNGAAGRKPSKMRLHLRVTQGVRVANRYPNSFPSFHFLIRLHTVRFYFGNQARVFNERSDVCRTVADLDPLKKHR